MKIDGKKITEQILKNLQKRVGELKKKNITPCLAIILIGHDPASLAYVRQKELKAKSIGIKTAAIHLPARTSQPNLIKTIQQFNNDSNVHGIVVQQPLPSHVNPENIINAIDPRKDVDGFNPESKFETPINMAVLTILEEIFLRGASTPRTVARQRPRFLRGELRNWLKTKRIVILGKGKTGGKPIINALQKLGIQPIIIDSKTMNPQLLTKKADIIISAVGKSRIVTSDNIKKGVVLISVGLFKGKDRKLHGDYEEDEIKKIASFYTPTPGGVGPVNVAMLLKNLILAAETAA